MFSTEKYIENVFTAFHVTSRDTQMNCKIASSPQKCCFLQRLSCMLCENLLTIFCTYITSHLIPFRLRSFKTLHHIFRIYFQRA